MDGVDAMDLLHQSAAPSAPDTPVGRVDKGDSGTYL
jgi:hypothetical protein